MPLFNEILTNPINLIKKYIEENKFYTQEPSEMSISNRMTTNMYWLFGRNTELTAKKVKLAEEFIILLQGCITTNFNAAEPKSLQPTLELLREKINLEAQTVLEERITQRIEPGSYDASLTVFSKLIALMLDRAQSLEHALTVEKERPESHITKILLFLEKTLFNVKFYAFVQDQGVLLNLPQSFTREHNEYVSKILTDTIPALYATKIEKAHTAPELVLSRQRILLQQIISGLMFNLQNKQQSIGVVTIMTELGALKQGIEAEQSAFEREQQRHRLHG